MESLDPNLLSVEQLEKILEVSDKETQDKILARIPDSYIRQIKNPHCALIGYILRHTGDTISRLYNESDKKIREKYGVSAFEYFDLDHA